MSIIRNYRPALAVWAAAITLLLCATCALAQSPPAAAPAPLPVVAAENFYGDLASQIGGTDVLVTSILSNPDEDPHLFEASPSVGRALSGARIVIYNGADYDPWMTKLLAATSAPQRQVIIVADLLHRKAGDNPHLWYDPAAAPPAAKAFAVAAAAADPTHAADYDKALQAFLQSLQPMDAKIAEMRQHFAGTPVAATEPVFGYMAAALGLKMRNERFQIAVMNNTEPRASDVAAFENDLRHHRVRVLLYNSQATDPAAQRLLQIARASHVPVVGVTETEPKGKTYQTWMMGQLNALDIALSSARS
jgi:zinc/manganese transport system substrate-binding protein